MRPQPARRLSDAEVAELLALDVPAHLGSLDAHGHPRVSPIWFLWQDGAIYMTSVPRRRHVRDLRHDPRAAVCIDVEDRATRRNRQVRARGVVELSEDDAGDWTKRITRKYMTGPGAEAAAERRAAMTRVVIMLRPVRLEAFGTPESR